MFRRLALPLVMLAGFALPASSQSPSRASLTIYTRDLAFVRESRTLQVGSSRDTVRLTAIPDRIDATSVRLSPAGRARVTRLAYQFDVASGDRILERGRGRRVRVALRDDRVVEGTLVGGDGGSLMVRTEDGALEVLSRGAVETVRMPSPPRDLAFEPRLEAVIENGNPGRVQAELSYLTGGLSWSAEHTFVRTAEGAGDWSAAVSIENASGQSYEVSKLALVAGEPRRAGGMPPPMPMMRAQEMSMVGKAAGDFAEETFGEYHLYTLDRAALLRDRETQILSMLESRPVTGTARYVARPGAGVLAQFEFKNTRAAGLGEPLPAGRVRFYERDAAGDVHFTGETTIKHTPEGENLTLDIGTAFDLVAERREIANRRISDREREYRIEVKLRNRKKTGVTIVVEEPVAGDNEVIQKSHEPVRKDANTLQFTIPVAPGKEEVLTYTVRVRY